MLKCIPILNVYVMVTIQSDTAIILNHSFSIQNITTLERTFKRNHSPKVEHELLLEIWKGSNVLA